MSSERFDQLAATWDDDPVRQALATAIATAIQADVPLRPHWTALDYGCGTGAMSFRLSDKLKHIIAADTSPGMLEVARRKLADSGTANVTLQQLHPGSKMAPPAEPVDLIVCSMSVHHVEDLRELVADLVAQLAPGGWLAIADLHSEDGSFHQDQAIPHKGFEPAVLGRIFAAAGLTGARWRTIHTLERQDRCYPIFLLTLQKSPRHLF